VWLSSPSSTASSAYASPNVSRVQRDAQLFEDQLQAIRAKLRASSYFSGVEDWERLFERADKDGNGVIDEEELVKICAASIKGAARDFSVTDRDVRALFRHLDKDGDGGIQYEEFESFLEGRTNFRITEEEQAEAMALLRQERAQRRRYASKSKVTHSTEPPPPPLLAAPAHACTDDAVTCAPTLLTPARAHAGDRAARASPQAAGRRDTTASVRLGVGRDAGCAGHGARPRQPGHSLRAQVLLIMMP
jgi:Ca2+-binding EF-hand superfamily protein